MADTWSKGVLRPLLLLNLLMYATVLGLAAWSIDKIFDRENHLHLRGNMLTAYLIIFSLISGAMGVCSTVAGLIHLCAWRGDSLAAAVSSGLISWAMTSLTFGLSFKHMSNGNRGALLNALESFIIILTVTHLLYLITLHLGISSSKYGVGYRNRCNAYEALKDSATAPRPDATV